MISGESGPAHSRTTRGPSVCHVQRRRCPPVIAHPQRKASARRRPSIDDPDSSFPLPIRGFVRLSCLTKQTTQWRAEGPFVRGRSGCRSQRRRVLVDLSRFPIVISTKVRRGPSGAIAAGSSSKALVVGTGRFELPTPGSQSRCATRLRHVPFPGDAGTATLLHVFETSRGTRR